MKEFDVQLEDFKETMIYGIWMKSNDRNISRDIHKLSKEYCEVVKKKEKEVLPFYVLDSNHKDNTGDFQMFIASTIEESSLEPYKLKEGTYAKITVKPKLGFLWGAVIGEAKKYFYKEWLPKSGYETLNFEYELHTEKSVGKDPAVDIVFGICKIEEGQQ
ncbi:MAG: GyrI-like domain-containing protein [Clostridium sp.]|nr:GyrI-like domain-containing protein [Clostridium sp.]